MPVVNIVLDPACTQAPFRPGSRVYGKVTCRVPKREKISDSSVVFKGKVTTRVIQKKSHNRTETDEEEIILFRFVQPLFAGEFTVQDQTLEWPFEFTFPTAIRYGRKERTFGGRNVAAYPVNTELPLPPSMFRESNGWADGGDVRISYHLKAKVNEKSILRSSDAERQLALQQSLLPFVPPPSVPLIQKMHVCRWADEKLRTTKLTFKQSLKQGFSSDPALKTPTIWFQASITLPTHFAPGHSMPLVMSAQQKRPNPLVDPESPTILIASLKITLTGDTVWRAAGAFADREQITTDTEAVAEWKLNNFRLPLDHSPLTVIDSFSSANFTPSRVGLVPDFATWTAAHAHTLCAEVLFVHLESGHSWVVKTKEMPFHVLPASAPGAQGITTQIVDMGPAKDRDVVAAPPVYEGQDMQPVMSVPTMGQDGDDRAPPVGDLDMIDRTLVVDATGRTSVGGGVLTAAMVRGGIAGVLVAATGVI